MQVTAKQCFFGPLALPPKFVPIAILQVLSLAFFNVFFFFFLFNCCPRNCCGEGDTGPQCGHLPRRSILVAERVFP